MDRLKLARTTLLELDAAAPLAKLQELDALLAAFPPLLTLASGLETERIELEALPNLTLVRARNRTRACCAARARAWRVAII